MGDQCTKPSSGPNSSLSKVFEGNKQVNLNTSNSVNKSQSVYVFVV